VDQWPYLGFSLVRHYAAAGDTGDLIGFWQIDLDNGALSEWMPPWELIQPSDELISPDGKQIAIIAEDKLSLANIDGRICVQVR